MLEIFLPLIVRNLRVFGRVKKMMLVPPFIEISVCSKFWTVPLISEKFQIDLLPTEAWKVCHPRSIAFLTFFFPHHDFKNHCPLKNLPTSSAVYSNRRNPLNSPPSWIRPPSCFHTFFFDNSQCQIAGLKWSLY